MLGDPLAPYEQWHGLVDGYVSAMQQVSRDMASLLAARFSVTNLGWKAGLISIPRTSPVPENAVSERSRTALREPGLVWPKCRRRDSTRTTRRRTLSFRARPVQLADKPKARNFSFSTGGANRSPPRPSTRCSRKGIQSVIFPRHAAGCRTPIRSPTIFSCAAPSKLDEGRRASLSRSDAPSGLSACSTPTPLPSLSSTLAQTFARHKESYRGASQKTYCARDTRPSLPRVLKLFRTLRHSVKLRRPRRPA